PALIEPLGLGAAHTTRAGATWAALVESHAGVVRHLQPGDERTRAPSAPDEWHEALVATLEAPEPPSALPAAPNAEDPSPPPHALSYRVQFTADQEYVDLLERARDLLWHQLPNGDLAQLQRLALEALVEKLTRRKCGSPRTERPAAARR